jgi:hypothetical protein
MKHFILTAGCKVLPGNVGLQFKIPYILCWNFRTIHVARNQVGTESSYRPASLNSLTGRYDNTIPTRFLAPIDSSKIPGLDGEDGTVHRDRPIVDEL